METKQCSYTKEDGQQCGAWALNGKDYCFRHNPDSRALSLEASRRGGLVKEIQIETPLEVMPVATTKDVVMLLAQTISEVRAGALDPKIATTVGYLASVLIKALEVAEVDKKIEEVRGVLLGREPLKGGKKDGR